MPGRVERETVSHYRQAEDLLGSGVWTDKLEGVGHAFLALVDELSRDPSERKISPPDDGEDGPRSWQS